MFSVVLTTALLFLVVLSNSWLFLNVRGNSYNTNQLLYVYMWTVRCGVTSVIAVGHSSLQSSSKIFFFIQVLLDPMGHIAAYAMTYLHSLNHLAMVTFISLLGCRYYLM